jgi:hypothetical protein
MAVVSVEPTCGEFMRMRDARPSAGHAPRGRGGVLATSRICKEFPERGRPGSLSPILWKEPARADGCGAMDSLLPSKIVAQIMVCMSDYSGKRPCQTESRDASWILPPKSICLPMIRLPARRAMGWYRPSCPPSHA